MSVSLFRRILLSTIVLFLAVAALSLYLLQSDWLRENVRLRTVAFLEGATGGQVDLKTFQFHWRLLTAQMDGLVLHGTESREDQPLFQASSVQVRLKIVSLWKRDIDIASLDVQSPRLHLLVNPDGTTNVPGPRRITPSRLVNQLLQCKVRRVALHGGLLQVNDRRVPLDLTAENVVLGLLYNGVGPHYDLNLASTALDLHWDRERNWQGSIGITSQLSQNHLTLTKAILNSPGSTVELSGSLQNFVQPVIRWNVQAQFSAPQLAKTLQIENVRDGSLKLTGSGYRDARTPFTFTGEIDGQRLSYLARPLVLSGANLKAKFIAGENGIRFPDLALAGPALHWRGSGEWSEYRRLSLQGNIEKLDLQTVAGAVGAKLPGWSATVRGPVSINGLLRPRREDFAIKGDLQLSPGSAGTPLSGNVAFAYRQPIDVLELGNSKLTLPDMEVTVAGTPGSTLHVSLNTGNLNELRPVLLLTGQSLAGLQLPTLLPGGRARFDGEIKGNLKAPQIIGSVALNNFQVNGAKWQNLRSSFTLGKSAVEFSSLTVAGDLLHAKATGRIALANWKVPSDSAFRLQGQFSGLDVAHLLQSYSSSISLPSISGIAAGTLALDGPLSSPTGTLQLRAVNLARNGGEHLDALAATLTLNNGQVQLSNGEAKSGPAVVNFTGSYGHVPGNWQSGTLSLDIDSNTFPLSALAAVRQRLPDLSAQTKLRLKTALLISPGHLQLGRTEGTVSLANVSVNHVQYGGISLTAFTRGQTVEGHLTGALQGSPLSGKAELQLTPEMPVDAQLQFGQLDLPALTAVLFPAYRRNELTGSVRGDLSLAGPLEHWEKIRAAIRLEDLQVASMAHRANLTLRNSAPVLLEAGNGTVTIRSMQLTGSDTRLSVAGAFPLAGNRPMQLKVEGTTDLRIAELLNPDLESSGEARISASLGGTPLNPAASGTLEIRNGSIALSTLPIGLTDLNGAVQFDKDRATLQKVTARAGGGKVALAGFATLSAGHPLVYRLEADSQDVRFRYAGSISVTSASQLTLTGTSQNSILAGTATVSRVIFNPNADVGTLLASTAAIQPVGEETNFLSGLQFDIHVDSSPNLQLSTSLSRDVQASIDLQLRGNAKNPVLLGTVEADEGDIRVFGSRYSINRGQINFTNPAKIDPVLDLDLRTQARGINVDVTISGTLNKLNINYRSDPPLQPRDIIALLTVGRAPGTAANIPNTQLPTDTSALQTGVGSVINQAVSPSSNRLQKLFGITNIRIDPLVQGVVNTSQARLTFEQQISRQITVTYVTNLSQTSEQVFRLEYSLNPQFSLVALRDDNGEFGIDILYKKRFK